MRVARPQLALPLAEPVLPTLDLRSRGTRFLRLPVRSVLNDATSTRMPFWSLNPYVGCEFGCSYCYARDTHRWTVERAADADRLDRDTEQTLDGMPAWESFERAILVKSDAARVLRQTLDPKKLQELPIAIGTATDPYQPAERRFRVTRDILTALLGYRGLKIGIVTKSALVTRDVDVLLSLAERHDLKVYISLATMDARLARVLEARSPIPAVRIAALEKLASAGVPAGLFIAPILPAITDGWDALAALMDAAKGAGAGWVSGTALRLGPVTRARFLPVLQQSFPELVSRYERHFRGRANTRRPYERALRRRLTLLQEAFGFPVAEYRRSQERIEGSLR